VGKKKILWKMALKVEKKQKEEHPEREEQQKISGREKASFWKGKSPRNGGGKMYKGGYGRKEKKGPSKKDAMPWREKKSPFGKKGIIINDETGTHLTEGFLGSWRITGGRNIERTVQEDSIKKDREELNRGSGDSRKRRKKRKKSAKKNGSEEKFSINQGKKNRLL